MPPIISGIRECPSDTAPCQAVLEVRVVPDDPMIVVADEIEVTHLTVGGQRCQYQAQAHQPVMGSTAGSWVSLRRGLYYLFRHRHAQTHYGFVAQQKV